MAAFRANEVGKSKEGGALTLRASQPGRDAVRCNVITKELVLTILAMRVGGLLCCVFRSVATRRQQT